jgi:hypothetical protein
MKSRSQLQMGKKPGRSSQNATQRSKPAAKRIFRGQPTQAGVTQGQNGEQGNSTRSEFTKPLGKLEH